MLKPTYRLHHGFRMPLGFPLDGFTSGIAYQAQADDTFIVTYPKCGTTWTQHIIWLLVNNGQPLEANDNINRHIPHLEEVGKACVASLKVPRFIKTHLPYHLTPHHPQAKYIYVARNPFDCVVSFYNHTRGFPQHYNFAEGTFEDFFTCFIQGEVDFGDYFDHLRSWYDHRHQVQILWLIYENLLADPQSEIKRLAQFLGSEYTAKVENPELLRQIIYHSSFGQMSQNQQRWCSQRPTHMPPFIRKGEVGDSKNYFSPQQAQALTDKLIATTKGTTFEQWWTEDGPWYEIISKISLML